MTVEAPTRHDDSARPVRDISENPVPAPTALPAAAVAGGLLGLGLLVLAGVLIRDVLAGTGAISGDTWSNPRALGHRPECLGQLVDHAGLQTRARVHLDSWSTRRALGRGPESPGTACRQRMPVDPGPSPPGQVGDPVGPQTQAQVPWESWLIPRAFRPRPESPGTFGRNRGPSESGRSRPGQLVNPAGPRARARGAREAWTTPQCL